MRDRYCLGMMPRSEPVPRDSHQAMLACGVFRRQLERTFMLPAGTHFAMQAFCCNEGLPLYYEVVIVYRHADPAHRRAVYEVDDKLPDFWDNFARVELALFGIV